MRRLLTSIFIVTLSITAYSQDLIITNDGDTINCKITNEKHNNVYFTFNHNGDVRNTLLPLAEIQTRKYNYYNHAEVNKEEMTGYKNHDQWRFAVYGGPSFLTSKIHESVPSDFKVYMEELKSGYHFGGEAQYFMSETFGFGLKYGMFRTSNSVDNIYVEDGNGNRRYGRMSDDITVTTIAPMVMTRFYNASKSFNFNTAFSIGYVGYEDIAEAIDPFTITGSTVTAVYDIGFDLEVAPNFLLGMNISYLTGVLTSLTVSNGGQSQVIDLDQGEYEGLNRLDISFGLRYAF